MERIDANTALSHPWIKSQPPLHRPNTETKTAQRRLQTRHRRSAHLEVNGMKAKHRTGRLTEDESSVMSDSTWTEYMKTKASPLYKRQKTTDKNIIIPLGFQDKLISKEKILGDQESTMSPSNIDSVLATEDSNSQLSSQFDTLQMLYYKNMMSAETEEEKERARKEYAEYMKANELNLPLIPVTENNIMGSGVIIPKVGSLKERKISVHDQFENIDEDSEDGLDSKGLDLTKLDRMYGGQGTTNSVVSAGSFKSTHVPVEISNASYIEKVGVWLNEDTNDSRRTGKFDFHQDKYKISDTDSLLSSRRTISQKSNLTTSDHSQASFNRVVLPPQKRNNSELVHTQSFISNATSTTELLPSSLKWGSTGSQVRETIINMPQEGSSFKSNTFQPFMFNQTEA